MKRKTLLICALFCQLGQQAFAQVGISSTTSTTVTSFTMPTGSVNIGSGNGTGGSQNIVIGANIAPSTTGSQNVFIGSLGTAASNSSGIANTFVGAISGNKNTTGLGNTFVGQYTGYNNDTGYSNTYIGQGSGANGNGRDGTFLGQGSGLNTTFGNGNTFLGKAAGQNNTTGSNNLAVGTYADFGTSALTNATAIGYGAIVNASNSLVLGNSAVSVGIGVTSPSDQLHTNGTVRFQGLPSAPTGTDNSVLIDLSGRLYRGSAWLLSGNTVNPGDYLGSINPADVIIKTHRDEMARFTQDGNFEIGPDLVPGGSPRCLTCPPNVFNGGMYSQSMGTNNTVTSSYNSLCVGSNHTVANTYDNLATGSSHQVTDTRRSISGGETNTLQTCFDCLASGNNNNITSQNSSFAAGDHNDIVNPIGLGLAGVANITLGNNNHILGSSHSIAIGNYINATGTNVHVYGEKISNTANNSIAMGFNNTRTVTITEDGVGIMVSNLSNYRPVHRLEVDATPTGSVASNIAFINLPWNSDDLPIIKIDPSTGELFRSKDPIVAPIAPPQGGSPIITDDKIATQKGNIENALSIISKITPKVYHQDSHVSSSLGLNKDKETYGIIAQDIQSILPGIVTNVTIPSKEVKGMKDTLKAVDYSELIPLLIQAVKDQQAQIQDQQKSILALSNRLKENDAKQETVDHAVAKIDVLLSGNDFALIDQNTPNPFSKQTVIPYYLPQSVKSAFIQFADAEGRVIKTLEVSSRGKGLINVYGSELATGIYTYTLMADGKVIATKKMQILR